MLELAMGNIFVEALENTKKLVWPEIEKGLLEMRRLPEFCQVDEKYSNIVNFNYNLIEEYPKRLGKYFRPTLVMLVAKALGVEEKEIIPVAAAMQMSEDWILNHDDIEDDSMERRGKPTLHRMYSTALAINAGDGLQTLMWHKVGEMKKELREEFYWIINRTILGQTIEIKWLQDNRNDLTDEDILLILESKTGYYTIGGPMRLGGILGNLSSDQLNKLYEFGKLMGYCFQIKDDLLDLTSDFAGQKKQMFNDIYEGKRTIMLMHLMRTTTEKEKLVEILNKKREEKTDEEVKWIIGEMKKYGSIDYGQKMMEKYANECKNFFDKELTFLPENEYKQTIRAGIDFVISRDH